MGNHQGLTIMSPPALTGAGGAVPATSNYWRLSETVTACLASERMLMLDVGRDRYLALPAIQSECFLAWLQSPGDPPPQACVAILAELGISASAAEGVPVTCSVGIPTPMDSPCLARQRIGLGDVMSVARSVIAARRDLRSRPLAEVLERRFPPTTRGLNSAADLQSRLAIFRSARPLVPIPRVCLHDCLALVDWLGTDALGLTLVLGVSAFPFAAHSWLQAGDLVADDHPESPSRYVPILHLP